MSEIVGQFSIALDQVADYEFRVTFDKTELDPMTIDEPPPLGRNAGPNPSRLLATSVGSCLAASLLFCARKSRVEIKHIRASINVQMVRNERKRLRVGRIAIEIEPEVEETERERARRCLDLFEDYCTVTQSVRDGIDIEVKVKGFEE